VSPFILATLVIAPTVAPDQQVAFAARFYFPPGDRRISRSQVYVCKLDGKRRRQITSGNTDIYAVKWVGKDHLVWMEGDKFVFYSLSTSKVTKRLSTTKSADLWESSERGMPRPWSDDRVLQPSGAVAKSPEKLTKSLWDPGELKLDSGQIVSWPGVSNGFDKWKYRFEGENRTVTVEGMAHRIFKGRGQYAFLETFEGGASAGSEQRIYSFDPSNAKGRVIIDEIDSLDFDPDSRYWSGIEPWRPLVAYGKDKKVWASSIYVGDTKTGKRWFIAKGLVLGGTVQIRPGL
jgi:hypothetical protein